MTHPHPYGDTAGRTVNAAESSRGRASVCALMILGLMVNVTMDDVCRRDAKRAPKGQE
jgi:hypothetical protein